MSGRRESARREEKGRENGGTDKQGNKWRGEPEETPAMSVFFPLPCEKWLTLGATCTYMYLQPQYPR